MRGCNCPAPYESSDSRKAGTCNRCGKIINPDILSTDKNVREFFDNFARSLPTITPAFHDLRYQAELRERRGREEFGLRYLARDNLAEGREEEQDGVLYVYLDLLQCKRNGEDTDLDLAMTEAYHLYKAYEANRRRAERRKGSP